MKTQVTTLTAVDFRTWRKSHKLTQTRLARWFHKSRQTVINWEDGSTPVDGAAAAFVLAFDRLGEQDRTELSAVLDATP